MSKVLTTTAAIIIMLGIAAVGSRLNMTNRFV
jgi:hypothetical protein